MSAQGTLPSARRRRAPALIVVATVASVVAIAGLAACSGRAPFVVSQEASPDAHATAQVRLAPCEKGGYCESLWVGPDAAAVVQVAVLGPQERAGEIVWSRDARRVGVVVNGYQLRLFDAQSHAPAGQVNLVAQDADPTTRIARGVTFSDNGAAVTFDDCPRDRSGCRPGLVGLR